MALARTFTELFAPKGLEVIVKPENLRTRPLKQQDSAAAATAQTFTFEIPTDRLIHSILISIGEDTTAAGTQGTLADDLTDLDLNSNMGHLKEMTSGMSKVVSIINKEIMSTGYYKLYFTDPVIKRAMPLPSWLFSSIDLKLTDNAPAASNYHHIRCSVVESEVPSGLDVKDWRVLVERYLRYKKYGTSTGWMDYDHERAYDIFGYLYVMDDNGTLSATIFDKLTVLGIKPDGEHRIADEQYIAHMVEQDKLAYQSALGTGYIYLEFPEGYDSGQYRTLLSKLNVPSAGTDARLRVLERYLK
jgi:hypothetical protein